MTQSTVQQLFDLTGKTALVTGGAGWLGNAFCTALAEAGASIVVASRSGDRARQAASDLIVSPGQSHHGIVLDHMNTDSLETGFAQAQTVAGDIHILVNNGLEGLADDLTKVTHEAFTRHQANNAGYFQLARYVRDQAVDAARPASVINIGSMYGLVASYPDAYEGICDASSVAYHTLKGGTIQMTRHLAAFWAADRVRVNCLSPGPFPNPNSAPAELVERLCAKVPVGRMGTPSELKGAIVFLASEAASYVTGHNLVVDGGWTAW